MAVKDRGQTRCWHNEDVPDRQDLRQSAALRHLGERSLTSRIRAEILRFVEETQLQPGERLPSERQLAIELGVSRPSVREAVRILQSEGRLKVRHGQGVFVAEPQVAAELRRLLLADHSIDELFAMREVLEVPAARWAATTGNREVLSRVQHAHDELHRTSLSDSPDFTMLQRLDMQFHLSIVQASGNRFLEQTQSVLNSILAEGMQTTLTAPGRLEKSREEHRRILQAVLNGDSAAAAKAARRHIHAARAVALERSDTPALG